MLAAGIQVGPSEGGEKAPKSKPTDRKKKGRAQQKVWTHLKFHESALY